MSTQIIDLSQGMANVLKPREMPKGAVRLIENMNIHEGGAWIAIKTAAEIAALNELAGIDFSGIAKMFQWFPHYLPETCIDEFVFVAFYSNGDVKLIYRENV